jgi:hypothetical protein
LEKSYAGSKSEKQRNIIQVDRRSDLNVNTFFREYALKSKPVIITDIGSLVTNGKEWDINFIKSKCGDVSVTPLHYSSTAKTWARLQPSQPTTLYQYIDKYSKAEYYSKDMDYQYLHDWNLPIYCPQILDDFVIPKYFSGDYLQKIPNQYNGNNVIYVDEWPSLFIGPKGSQSAMHVDSFGSNFWMILLSGKKHWHLFSQNHKSFLYEDRATGNFEINSFNLDVNQFPLSVEIPVYECILEPGEILFVPAGLPHQVVNLEDTIAVSMNYIDISNYRMAIEEINREARAGDIASLELYQLLSRINLKEEPQFKDMNWRSFKNRQ